MEDHSYADLESRIRENSAKDLAAFLREAIIEAVEKIASNGTLIPVLREAIIEAVGEIVRNGTSIPARVDNWGELLAEYKHMYKGG